MRALNYAGTSDLSARADEWLARIRQRTAPRPQLQLGRDRAALLIIDMLRYFAHPSGRCYLPASKAIIGPIGSLAHAWREFGMPVIYTQHGHMGDGDLGMLGKFFADYIREGEPEGAIVDALAPVGNERVLRKTTYDAFLGTDLESILRSLGVDQVLVTGVLTHMCCETTARSAFCRGFEVFVPVDGVASSDEERHVGSLLNMADSVAVVTKVDEVLAWLATSRS